MRSDAAGRRLCTATTRQGNPCKAPAVTGAMVCRMHGGSSPQVKEKAHRLVLEELVGPALVRLKQLVEDDSTPPAVQLGAARDILDRTGYKAPAQTEWDVIPPIGVIDGWVDQLEAEEVDLPE